MKKFIHVIDESLEEILMVLMLAAMTLIMGCQVFSRYILGVSLSWSEEITRYLFIWSAFKCKSLYQKMHFYQGGSVYQNVPKTWKNDF